MVIFTSWVCVKRRNVVELGGGGDRGCECWTKRLQRSTCRTSNGERMWCRSVLPKLLVQCLQ